MSLFCLEQSQRFFFPALNSDSPGPYPRLKSIKVGLCLLLICWHSPALARFETGLIYGGNRGKQIFETGSKVPDLSGFAGGSRLTYARNSNYMGLAFLYHSPGWNFEAALRGTGWYRNTGTSRNEDFSLRAGSKIRGAGINWRHARYRDTPYVISDSRNFADAYGRTAMTGYNTDLRFDYYFWQPDAGEDTSSSSNAGFFGTAMLRYDYAKYYVYDVQQFIRFRSGPQIFPIGYGNSFASSIMEWPLGLGYAWQWPSYRLELMLAFVSGMNRARDFHKQRNINFITDRAFGDGFLYYLDQSYQPEASRFKIRLRLHGHRYYSVGSMRAEGGLNSAILTTALVQNQRVWISTKEAGIEIGILRKIGN